MSLIRQIRLLLLATVLLAFAGSVLIATNSARDLLQTQLRLKNSDNAASLALALSQQKGDAELMGLVMSAQFDTGFYRRVQLVAPTARWSSIARPRRKRPRLRPGSSNRS